MKMKTQQPKTYAAAAKSLQSCPTLCDPMDRSPPGSSVPGILQARMLEWVAISFSNYISLKDNKSNEINGKDKHHIQNARYTHISVLHNLPQFLTTQLTLFR